MHKLTKTFLHLYISLISVVAFTFGWAFLAHSQKPTPLVPSQMEISTLNQSALEPIPSLNQYLGQLAVSESTFKNASIATPRLRTGGS